MRYLRYFVLFLLITSIAVAVGTAQGGPDIDEEIEREEEDREVSVKSSADKVEIESKSENKSTGEENSFEVEFKADEKVEIKLKYEESSGDGDSEFERELSYEVETEALIEFEDENGNGVLDEGEEVSRYDLEEADFSGIDYTTKETDNGVREHVLEAQSTDGVFTMTLHAVGSFAEIGSETVSPTEVKIDIAIDDYDFKSDNSRIALLSKIKAENETETETEDLEEEDEEGISIQNADAAGFFTWKKTAQVDGRTEQVTADVRQIDEEDGEHNVLLSYPQGSRIVHDPKVGFRIGPQGVSGDLIPRIIMITLIGLGVITLAWNRPWSSS